MTIAMSGCRPEIELKNQFRCGPRIVPADEASRRLQGGKARVSFVPHLDGLVWKMLIRRGVADSGIRNRMSLNDSRYYDFYEARRRVLEAATKLPLETFFSDPNTPSDVQLVSFEQRDTELNENNGGTPPAQVP